MADTSPPSEQRQGLISRRAVWLVFYAGIALAWLAMARAMQADGVDGQGLWATLCLGAAEAEFGPLVVMWLLMALAMMLPTFAPAVGTYLDLTETAAARRPDTLVLVAGYGAVWAVVGVLGAALQVALSSLSLIGAEGRLLAPMATASLLLLAGLYQFSALKDACLAKCRMPLTYFIGHWRPGAGGAFRMGVDLGIACFGCCWALMALVFVGGTMNLYWMGLATLFMIFEKLPDLGQRLQRPAGVGLILAGGAVAVWAGGQHLY